MSQPTCEPPQQLKCNPDQETRLIKTADGCQKFVCECKPIEDCVPIEQLANKTVEEGFEKVVNKAGCCPTVDYVCNKNLCPPPDVCPQFYHLKKLNVSVTCCPIYSCEAPKKCIVDLVYTNSEEGGEKLRNEQDKQKILKDIGEKWQDGPCRECECIGSATEGYHSNCMQKNCPTIENSEDNKDYVLELIGNPGECCSSIKRTACKYEGEVYAVGDKWPVKHDYCTFMECVNTTSGVRKTTERMNCDTKCEIGYEYVPAKNDSELCCGSCKPVACVVDGVVKTVGKTWKSPDFCTEFVCVNDNGAVRILSSFYLVAV